MVLSLGQSLEHYYNHRDHLKQIHLDTKTLLKHIQTEQPGSGLAQN